MDHDVDVALWQRGIQHQEDEPEVGPAYYLFEASIIAFSAILRILATDLSRLDSGSYSTLRNEFQKFYMWNEGFSTRTGDLDHVLDCSKNLKSTVLGLMVQWTKAISKVPGIFSDFDWSSCSAHLANLEMLAGKVDQIAKAATADMKSQYSAISNLNIEDESDIDSDSESSFSEYSFEDIIEDLSIYTESLANLSLSLDRPAADTLFTDNVNNFIIDEISGVLEPVRPFILLIRDRFPSLDVGLARKLGEINWQRRERLRIKLASAPEMEEISSTDDGSSSAGDTIIGSRLGAMEDQQTVVSTIRSSISLPRTFQSTTISSQFSEPSVFDNTSVSIPPTRRVRPAESVTSFATSIADGVEYGQRRLPSLPEDHVYGLPFQCMICGDILTDIQHRADWKKHVYKDLEPYICLFSDCKLGLHTFRSRREWMNHEFQAHRVYAEWRCNLCQKVFETQNLFRRHIENLHNNDVLASQTEELISVSKRLMPCKLENELCPFCLTPPSHTRRGFMSHVGKHQQEIALAALPRLEDKNDAVENNDDSKDSDDDSEDDSSGDGGNDITVVQSKMEEELALDAPPKVSISIDGHSVDITPLGVDAQLLEQLPEKIRKEVVVLEIARLRSRSLASDIGQQSYIDQEHFKTLPNDIWNGVLKAEMGNQGDTKNHDLSQSSRKSNFFQDTDGFISLPPITSSSQVGDHIKLNDRQFINTTWAPQNRLMSSIREFEQALQKCEVSLDTLLGQRADEKLPVLEELSKEVHKLLQIRHHLIANSSNLAHEAIETSIESLAICRTQLKRLNTVLQSVANALNEQDKKSKRRVVTLRYLFNRQSTLQASDNAKAQNIFTELRSGRKRLLAICSEARNSRNSKKPSQTLMAEKTSPQLVLSPKGKIRVDNAISRPSTDQALSLQNAIKFGHKELARWLLSEDANIEDEYANRENPIYAASVDGCKNIVILLLAGGADINSDIRGYGTALEAVALKGNLDMVELLLTHGADINKGGGLYCTPLQAAAFSCHLEIINYLISHGADVNIRGGVFGSALQAAAYSGNLEITRLLINHGADINAQGGTIGSAIQAAAYSGNLELTKLLLDSGADITVKKGPHGTALDIASKMKHQEIIQLLLSWGAHSVELKREDFEPERKSLLPPLRSSFLDDYQSILNKPASTRGKSLITTNLDMETEEIIEFESSNIGEPSTRVSESRLIDDNISVPQSLKDELSLEDEIDGEAYACKLCEEILIEGKGFKLAGNRWHPNCFRCNTCGILLDLDADLLLLGDGSLMCDNCTYLCSGCGNKIKDLAILTGGQAFCAPCFKCKECKRKIENLRYARTSQGIVCMSCYESLMARKRKNMKNALQTSLDAEEQPLIPDQKNLAASPSNPISLNGETGDSMNTSNKTSSEQQ